MLNRSATVCKVVLLLVLTTSLCLSSCGVRPQSEAELSAIVSQDQFDKAFQIVAGIKYLPFQYKTDGCYARSLYMAMELAAANIPTSAQFAFQTDRDRPLRLADGTMWGYHVAPLIRVGAAGTPTILDPSMGTTGLSLSEWVAKMGNVKPRLVAVPGSTYQPSGLPSSSQPLIKSLSELPAFSVRDIANACQTMFNYIDREPGAEKSSKKRLLLSKSNQLVTALRSINKLQTTGAGSFQCGGQSIGGSTQPGPVKPIADATTSTPSSPSTTKTLDCNADYRLIFEGKSTGLCINRSTNACYNYANGDVQYDRGNVTCPSSLTPSAPPTGTPIVTPATSSNASMLDCNADYGKIFNQRSQGICINKSTNTCYRYNSGEVQYGSGSVSCSLK